MSEEIKRLEPSLAAEDIIQEEVVTGVLWKKGESGTVGGSSWKQRFVVLAAGKLSYYTTQAGACVGWVLRRVNNEQRNVCSLQR